MLRIIQTIDSLHTSKGGPSRTVMQLSAALSKCSDTAISIACNESSTFATVPIFGKGIYSGVKQLAPFDSRSSSILHDNGIWRFSNLAAVLSAKRHGLPYIISPHGMLEPWALQHNKHRKKLAYLIYQRWCLQHAAAFHATCNEEAISIRQLGLTQPIAVVGNGIEPVPAIELAQMESPRTALFLSRLHPKKGLSELIEAWSIVRPAGWKLRIVGPDDGGYRKVLETMITDHKLHDSVELRQEVNDQEKWLEYRRAALFVLPTHSENFGLVIGEALASGVPVITTTGTPWKAIAERKCGWIINPNTKELAAALAHATTLSAAELQTMGSVGKHWIPCDFSWSRIAIQMLEFYSWVTSGMKPLSRPEFIV